MFIDYYAILEINYGADYETVKSAYRIQVKRWHPDKNPEKETTEKMQSIVEAYLILKDADARKRYDKQYMYFQSFKKASNDTPFHTQSRGTNQSYEENFFITDEILKKWVSNARAQAKILAKEALEELIGASKAGGTAIANEAIKGIVRLLIFSIIIFVIFKTCK